MSSSEAPDPAYTVFIRLPFPRGDFVDPPAVDWDASKDKSLWKTLSKASKNSDIDWNALATKFDVTLPFLLQQAAWLYERQLSQVRAQMRKVGVSKVPSPSPVPGADSIGGEMMRRTGSGGGPRVPSSLSMRRDSPLPRNDITHSNTPSRSMAPPMSRTSSTNTAIQSRQIVQHSPRLPKAALNRRSVSPTPKVPASKSLSESEAAESSSSSESSSEAELPLKSRLLRRPPRFTSKLGRSEDADDDDDTPAFLPFSNTDPNNDPSATLREDPKSSRRTPGKKPDEILLSQTSDSSASSTAHHTKQPQRELHHTHRRPPGPLSPRRTAELAGRSPMHKGKGLVREGSDGSPSMGSSFSDLDDASVTQSALEEALASKMQAGGMASKMSTISQALRSRYL